MRVTALTLAMLVAMDTDAQVLLWFVALVPALVAATFALFLLSYLRRPRRRVQRDDRRWRGVHRRTRRPSPPGRHAPARGQRLKGVSRQTQVEEPTVAVSNPFTAHEHKPYRDGVRIRCEVCKLDLPRPDGQPDIGRHGFQSWR